MKQHFQVACVAILLGLVTAGLVKRDVSDDVDSAVDSVKDALGLGKTGVFEGMGQDLDNLDETKYCLADSTCYEPVQICDKTNYKLYGVCTFKVWFWAAIAGVIALIFFSCITSIVCCCCSSLCRKST